MSRAKVEKAETSSQMSVNRQAVIGIFLMVSGTVCFASKSIFIKWAYELGATPEAALWFRQFFATPLFFIIFMMYRSKLPVKPQKGEIVKACLAGLLCFFLSPLFDFTGLHYVSAIVERILIMSYPIFVLIISAFSRKQMISILDLTVILVVNAGLFLAIGGWDTSLLNANILGATLILLSSITYAMYLFLSGRLVKKIGGIRMNLYGMLTASLAMVIYLGIKQASLESVNLLSFRPSVYGVFFIIAVVATVIPFILMLEGIKRIGAERGAMISMSGPVLTIVFGAFFLGEHLSMIQWAGCLLVLITISIVEWKKVKTLNVK
ncbi:DMT family transporter [Bacillus gobiensis]|uniref:DMT family transporter n=1 Tax=Bacillus gobiensis TaxID=1441095 RepID=UPI003D1E5142